MRKRARDLLNRRPGPSLALRAFVARNGPLDHFVCLTANRSSPLHPLQSYYPALSNPRIFGGRDTWAVRRGSIPAPHASITGHRDIATRIYHHDYILMDYGYRLL